MGGALCKQSSEVREMYRVNECIHYKTGVVIDSLRSVINFREVMTCRQTARRRPVDRLLMAMARRERCPVTVFPAGGEIAARNESEQWAGRSGRDIPSLQ